MTFFDGSSGWSTSWSGAQQQVMPSANNSPQQFMSPQQPRLKKTGGMISYHSPVPAEFVNPYLQQQQNPMVLQQSMVDAAQWSVVRPQAPSMGGWGKIGALPPPTKKPNKSMYGMPLQVEQVVAQGLDDGTPLEHELQKQNLYKTELCQSFSEKGSCRYGHKCQFAHGQHELRTLVRHPKYKTELCKKFTATGNCPYGNRCRFIHGNEFGQQLQPHMVQLPQQQGVMSSKLRATGSLDYDSLDETSEWSQGFGGLELDNGMVRRRAEQTKNFRSTSGNGDDKSLSPSVISRPVPPPTSANPTLPAPLVSDFVTPSSLVPPKSWEEEESLSSNESDEDLLDVQDSFRRLKFFKDLTP